MYEKKRKTERERERERNESKSVRGKKEGVKYVCCEK